MVGLANQLLSSSPVMAHLRAPLAMVRGGAAVSALVGFLLSSGVAAAADGHHHPNAAGPSLSHVRQYKLDDELTHRAVRDANGHTRVIVELQPGAVLPAELQRF